MGTISKRISFFAILTMLGSACSLDANITSMSENLPVVEDLERADPDFVHGEIVTTSSGFQVKAVLGEISEETTATNGWRVEGVFYE